MDAKHQLMHRSDFQYALQILNVILFEKNNNNETAKIWM